VSEARLDGLNLLLLATVNLEESCAEVVVAVVTVVVVVVELKAVESDSSSEFGFLLFERLTLVVVGGERVLLFGVELDVLFASSLDADAERLRFVGILMCRENE